MSSEILNCVTFLLLNFEYTPLTLATLSFGRAVPKTGSVARNSLKS